MKLKKIHFHLDYVEKYNRILAGLEPPSKCRKFKNPQVLLRSKMAHEAKAAALLVKGIKGRSGVGMYDRSDEKFRSEWYEKVTAAKNAKRVAAGLKPYAKVKNP
jgi:hypothetical protein